MSEKEFAYTASNRIMIGLHQEVGLIGGVNYRASGYASARVLTLKLANINPHYLPDVLKLRDQLTMWAGLPDRYKIRVGWHGTTILIEIPKPPQYWKPVTIEAMEARRMIRRGLIATLGMGLQDDPKRINFTEESMAHVMISGQTRSGKTNTQRLIAWNIARNTSPTEARLVIFDVAKRGYKWRDFGNVTHLAHPVVTEIAEAESVLAWLTREIDRRAISGNIEPRVFCVVDELKALTDDSERATAHLSRIASVGGEFGLHLILATQYPQIKMLGSAELKRNVTTRLCGKVDDAQAASNALGLPGTGAELLQGYGDFLLRDTDDISRMTVAKIEAVHVAALEQGQQGRLDLPDNDTVNNAPEPKSSYHDPDPMEPGHVARALFDPVGVNKLGRELGIGSPKAQRLLKFAGLIYEAARQYGYNCLPESHPYAILDSHTG